jgi:uncharacterized MAPEG superfamily protein
MSSFPLPIPTVLLYGIAIAAVLIYLPFLAVAYNRLKIENGLVSPRTIFDKLPAYAQRATWAHQNAFEAFTLFTAAALMAYVTNVTNPIAAWAVLIFVIGRSLYPIFYILNVPIGRSFSFALGSLGIATLIGLSLAQVSSLS